MACRTIPLTWFIGSGALCNGSAAGTQPSAVVTTSCDVATLHRKLKNGVVASNQRGSANDEPAVNAAITGEWSEADDAATTRPRTGLTFFTKIQSIGWLWPKEVGPRCPASPKASANAAALR